MKTKNKYTSILFLYNNLANNIDSNKRQGVVYIARH